MKKDRPLNFVGLSSEGNIRTNNEDAFYVDHIWDSKTVLAIVADGLGGCEKGEVASNLAVETIVSYLSTYSNGDRLELLRQAVIAANNAIITNQEEIPGASNMSTVITVSIFDTLSRKVYMAHVGDTRLYVCTKNGGIEKLSHDHTLVGYKEEQGELTEIEAMSHPKRNEISKVLGSSKVDVDSRKFVELNSFDLKSNSIYLLCSDGLYDMITSAEISAVINEKNDLTNRSKSLIDQANKAGGKDNITVVLVENPNKWTIEKDKIMDIQHDSSTIKDSKNRNKYKFIQYIATFILGSFFGGLSYHIYIESHKIQNNALNVTDTIYINNVADSAYSLKLEQDSIIKAIELNLNLLKSTVSQTDSIQKNSNE